MSEWQEWFSTQESWHPNNNHLGPNIGTDHWEKMYQAFKARMKEETPEPPKE